MIRAHVAMGELDQAEAILNGAPAEISEVAEVEAARAQLELAKQAADAVLLAELTAAVEANPTIIRRGLIWLRRCTHLVTQRAR